MQLIWILLVGFLLASLANALNKNEEIIYANGLSDWNAALPEGHLEWLDVKEEAALLEDIKGPGEIHFLLYTNLSPDKEVELQPNYDSIKNSHFNPAHHTVFFIHGWKQDRSTSMNTDMRRAYFEKELVNFCFVEWQDAAESYLKAKNALAIVAERLAIMYDHLVLDHKVARTSITIVGHSLGAHVAGLCGKKVQSGRVQRIYGLDPAQPFFLHSEPENRFDCTDAEYVEQITTNAHQLGFAKKLAKVAIYVNGGKRQPGCGLIDHLTGLCSHRRSVEYFIEAINSSQFVLVKCENEEQALADQCGTVLSNATLAGEDNYLLESSVYQLHTNDKFPYARGMNNLRYQ